jgi:hypothetical protein
MVASIVEGLSRIPDTQVLWRPILNQGLVRFLDPRRMLRRQITTFEPMR